MYKIIKLAVINPLSAKPKGAFPSVLYLH